jgi:hypothetical protein
MLPVVADLLRYFLWYEPGKKVNQKTNTYGKRLETGLKFKYGIFFENEVLQHLGIEKF